MAVGVELPNSFLHVWMDVPLEFLRLARRDDGIRVSRRGWFAGRAHDHAGSADEQTAVLALHLVAEGHFHTITLVGTEHQGLNHVALQPGGHGSRIVSFLVASRF